MPMMCCSDHAHDALFLIMPIMLGFFQIMPMKLNLVSVHAHDASYFVLIMAMMLKCFSYRDRDVLFFYHGHDA